MNLMPRSSPASRISAIPTTGGAALAAATLILAGAPAAADPTHADEIKLFASTMAIARTARESCPGVELDESYLDGLRQRLHVVEADHDAFAPEAHAVAEVLKQGLAEAPSRQAWCDAVFRLYGPEGTLLRGTLRR